MSEPRIFEMRIPAPDAFINANSRQHRLAGTAQRTRSWRDAGALHARANRLPKLQRARIRITLHFPDARRRDDHNYFGTAKALIDGIVGDYGLLPNDSSQYLVGVELCGGERVTQRSHGYGPPGEVTITITEVTG
jgi:hypothetical protein